MPSDNHNSTNWKIRLPDTVNPFLSDKSCLKPIVIQSFILDVGTLFRSAMDGKFPISKRKNYNSIPVFIRRNSKEKMLKKSFPYFGTECGRIEMQDKLRAACLSSGNYKTRSIQTKFHPATCRSCPAAINNFTSGREWKTKKKKK